MAAQGPFAFAKVFPEPVKRLDALRKRRSPTERPPDPPSFEGLSMTDRRSAEFLVEVLRWTIEQKGWRPGPQVIENACTRLQEVTDLETVTSVLEAFSRGRFLQRVPSDDGWLAQLNAWLEARADGRRCLCKAIHTVRRPSQEAWLKLGETTSEGRKENRIHRTRADCLACGAGWEITVTSDWDRTDQSWRQIRPPNPAPKQPTRAAAVAKAMAERPAGAAPACDCADAHGRRNHYQRGVPRGRLGMQVVSSKRSKKARGAPGRYDEHLVLECEACGTRWHAVEEHDEGEVSYVWLDVGPDGRTPAVRARRTGGDGPSESAPKRPKQPRRSARSSKEQRKQARSARDGRADGEELAAPGSKLPAPGSLYAMPLDDGRFGVVWVLRHVPEGADGFASARGYGELVLVQLSAWIGEEPPHPETAGLTKALKLTHHNHNGAYRTWLYRPVPSQLRYLGKRKPTARQAKVECRRYAPAWELHAAQRLSQWRWDHDREAILAEDAEAEARERDRARLDGLTLQTLGREERLASAPRSIARAAREIIRDTISAIEAHGKRPAKRSVLSSIRKGVERFNKLLLEPGGYYLRNPYVSGEVQTAFFEIACVAGAWSLDDGDVTDSWRAW